MRNFIRWLLRILIDLIATVEVRGREYLPETGAFIIATNHLGMLDATMLFYAVDRWDVYVLVAEKWAKIPLLKSMEKYFNLIFIDRFNPDLKALRRIIGLMEQGKIMVIAPEGTRSRAGSMIEGKPGVSYLAAKLKQPIVPVGLAGTEDKTVLDNIRRLRRTHIVLRAGPAFSFPPLPTKNRDTVLRDYTDEIMCRIAALIPERYRGVYADHPRLKQLVAETPAL